MRHLIAPFFLLLVLSGTSLAQQTGPKTINTVTVSGTIQLISTPTVTDNGTVKRTTQTTSSYRIGNREILQLMVDNQIIPSIVGYSLVQKFQNDGTHLGYFARHTNGTEVQASESLFGFTQKGAALAFNTVVTQPSTPGGNVTTTGTIKGNTFGTLSVDGANCAMLDTVTKTYGKTAKLGSSTVSFVGVVSKATVTGSFTATGPTLVATLDSKSTKPVSDP